MFELAKLNSFSGPRAYQFLLRAANQALPEAQFEMGEYTSSTTLQLLTCGTS